MSANHPLRILFVSPFFDAQTEDPRATLDRFPILTALPAELSARGHSVRLLGLGPEFAQTTSNGVQYAWLPASAPVRLGSKLLHRWKPHHGPAYYQPSLRLANTIRALDPDIVHVFGLTMDLQLALIRKRLPRNTRIVVHYHGGAPASGPLRGRIQRRAVRGIDAALFTSPDQAGPWIQAGLLAPHQVRQLIETSSPFSGLDRDEARQRTGMSGNPVYLSAGRLHPIKDPLTMLRGFAHIARRQPEARLYLYYLTDELLQEARALAHSFPHIRHRVEFRGRARLDEMEAIYSSADILLQASIREWSGLAVLEALSCGCIPVVSNIPSFVAMIGEDGRHGRLFEPGDPLALADAALGIEDPSAMSRAARRYFNDELSFAAMARDLETIYQDLGREA